MTLYEAMGNSSASCAYSVSNVCRLRCESECPFNVVRDEDADLSGADERIKETVVEVLFNKRTYGVPDSSS